LSAFAERKAVTGIAPVGIPGLAKVQPQPLPRPFAKSGRNAIQRVTLVVEA
jgi:hypothetical protein